MSILIASSLVSTQITKPKDIVFDGLTEIAKTLTIAASSYGLGWLVINRICEFDDITNSSLEGCKKYDLFVCKDIFTYNRSTDSMTKKNSKSTNISLYNEKKARIAIANWTCNIATGLYVAYRLSRLFKSE